MRVNITKRIQTLKGRRYCPVVVTDSGGIQPDWVVVGGNKEKHPEGCYYLEWQENGQRKRQSVSNDATIAFNSKVSKIKELDARAAGIDVRASDDSTNRLELRTAMNAFLEKIKRSRQNRTWQGYKVVFGYFLEFSGKNYVEDIQRTDLLDFEIFLREKRNLAPRTVSNKLNCVKTFFDAQGMPKPLEKSDMPRYAKREVEIFEDHQLIDLYRSCPLRDQVLYDFMLMTGFRDQEARYVSRSKQITSEWRKLATP